VIINKMEECCDDPISKISAAITVKAFFNACSSFVGTNKNKKNA